MQFVDSFHLVHPPEIVFPAEKSFSKTLMVLITRWQKGFRSDPFRQLKIWMSRHSVISDGFEPIAFPESARFFHFGFWRYRALEECLAN